MEYTYNKNAPPIFWKVSRIQKEFTGIAKVITGT